MSQAGLATGSHPEGRNSYNSTPRGSGSKLAGGPSLCRVLQCPLLARPGVAPLEARGGRSSRMGAAREGGSEGEARGPASRGRARSRRFAYEGKCHRLDDPGGPPQVSPSVREACSQRFYSERAYQQENEAQNPVLSKAMAGRRASCRLHVHERGRQAGEATAAGAWAGLLWCGSPRGSCAVWVQRNPPNQDSDPRTNPT